MKFISVEIQLPNIPKITRSKRVKGKKAISKFLDTLDYNNQIPSSLDLTLIGRQEKHDYDDVA